jgi:hypothetical protein
MRLDKKFVEPCGAIPSRAFAGQMCSGTGCTLGFPTSPSPLVQACSLAVHIGAFQARKPSHKGVILRYSKRCALAMGKAGLP